MDTKTRFYFSLHNISALYSAFQHLIQHCCSCFIYNLPIFLASVRTPPGAGPDSQARTGDETHHVRDGRGDGEMGRTGQRNCTAGQEHVQHGILHVSVHTWRGPPENYPGSLHPGRVLQRGGRETLQGGQGLYGTGIGCLIM